MKTAYYVAYGWLTSGREAQLEPNVQAVITALKDNPHFPDPVPPLAQAETHLAAYVHARAQAKDGGRLATAAKNAARAELVSTMRELGAYIQQTSGGDLEILLSSKFPLQRPRHRLDVQPAPENLRLKQGKVSGAIVAQFDNSRHRLVYEWQTTTGETPGEWTNQPPGTATRATFEGFAPGTWVYVRVRSRVAAGASDWSGLARIMAV